MENSIISGAYDLHIHTAPDYEARKLDDVEMAQRIISSGMSGYVIKSHASSTTDRAYLVNKMFPECKAVASITLNQFQGGLNPLAVDIAALLGAKIVWFPTTDSTLSFERHEADPDRRTGYSGILRQLGDRNISCFPVRILDGNNKVLPEVRDVLDVICKHDLILGTGHLSTSEVFALVKAAREQGVRKIIITHVSSYRPGINDKQSLRDVEVQRELLKYNVYIEHCSLPVFLGRIPIEKVAAQIKEVGPDRIVLSSDLGRIKNPYPDAGFLEYCNKLLENGISESDVRKMIVHNPAALLDL